MGRGSLSSLQPIKGFRDNTGQDLKVMRFASNSLSALFQSYGFSEIETPIVESLSTFGDKIDVKPERAEEMFIFNIDNYLDHKKISSEDVVLRPEGTAPVCRYIANLLLEERLELPVKVFYVTPMFRNESVDSLTDTKTRSFYQAGVECFGSADVGADAEIFDISVKGLESLGFKGDVQVRISDSSLYESLIERIMGMNPQFDRKKLKGTLKEPIDDLSKYRALSNQERADTVRKQLDTLIDELNLAKEERAIIDYMSSFIGKKEDFKSSCSILKGYSEKMDAAVERLVSLADCLECLGTQYRIDLGVVRGLDFYTGPVMQTDVILPNGKVIAEVAGGGRYDKLVGRFLQENGIAGKEIPATGFAYGIERVAKSLIETDSLLNLNKKTIPMYVDDKAADYIIYGGNRVDRLRKATALRKQGYRVDTDFMARNQEQILEYASRMRIEPLKAE